MVVFGQKEAKATRQVRQEQNDTTTRASLAKKKKRLRENGAYGDAPTPTGKWSELTRDLASRRTSKKRQINKTEERKKKERGGKNRFMWDNAVCACAAA